MSSTHSTTAEPGQGVLLAVAWPAPRRRSLLHCHPSSGNAVLAEIDLAAAKDQAWLEDPACKSHVSAALAESAGAWFFKDWAGQLVFDHVLALPLQAGSLKGSLAVLLLNSTSNDIRLLSLEPTGGRSRPLQRELLSAKIAPLQGDQSSSYVCLSEDALGRLLLLQYSIESGFASFHRLEPQQQRNAWGAQWLASLMLERGRTITRILPLDAAAIESATVLQYDDKRGSVSCSTFNLSSRTLASCCTTLAPSSRWSSFWLRGYPNQQIVSIAGFCCLVEYDPSKSVLNIGRFGEGSAYGGQYGDWWRAQIPNCDGLRGVWPANGADEHGPVALLDTTGGGLALVGLPADPGSHDAQGLGTARLSAQWWISSLAGPVGEGLLTAVKEENWRHRRAALMLSQAKKTASDGEPQSEIGGEEGPAWLLHELSDTVPGAWRNLVAML